MAETREIVVPGDRLDDSGRYRPGTNTYKEGEVIFASRLGVKSVRGDHIHVIGLSGRYDPQRGDMVIGTIVEVGPSNWYINVGASGDVGMHVNDVPWRVEFGETAKYLAAGDTVLLKVFHVDELRKVQVTMKDRQARKLTGGILIEVSPSKVPRIIGRNGSMIGLIKNMTSTRMFVGQNGVIWIDGEPKDVQLAVASIRMVEEQAHTTGLTDKVRAFLESQGAVYRPDAEAAEADDGGHFTPDVGAPAFREYRERTAWEGPAPRERPPRREREDRGGRPYGDRGGGRGGGRGGDRRGGGGRGGERRGGDRERGGRGGERRGGDRDRPPRGDRFGGEERGEARAPREERGEPREERGEPREDRAPREERAPRGDRSGGEERGAPRPDRGERRARPFAGERESGRFGGEERGGFREPRGGREPAGDAEPRGDRFGGEEREGPREGGEGGRRRRRRGGRGRRRGGGGEGGASGGNGGEE